MALAVPDEEKMSEANRRQVQEALHRLDFYDGPIDGIFGSLTRASIRRFRDNIGVKWTGRLTAAEAGRLVSVTGLGTDAGVQGTGGLGISEAPVGHRQPKPADLPPLQEKQGNVLPPTTPQLRRTIRLRAAGPNATVGARVGPALTDKSRASARGVRRSRSGGAAPIRTRRRRLRPPIGGTSSPPIPPSGDQAHLVSAGNPTVAHSVSRTRREHR
jgi:peptidoglycan hydrolase-like protein with peptidoglycan-binding domain